MSKPVKELTAEDFAANEYRIKIQQRRKRNLKKLVEIFHRCRSGSFSDYDDSYAEFEEMYLSSSAEDIPRYASAAEDESYGMLSLHETVQEAISSQAGIPSSGEYLNVPAGVYDLDSVRSKNSTGVDQIEYRLVALSMDAIAVLAGMAAESKDVINDGIFASEEIWKELRAAFPLEVFRERVTDMEGADFNTDPPKDKPYYWPED